MRLLKIGRDSSCDITINSQRVSALHAEMTLLNSGDILLEDKGSLNGTFVQNQRIQPGKSVNIRRGDAVRFGNIELQWSQIPIEDNTGYRAVWGIGTDFHNDFQVAGSTVSRFHATIKQAIDGKFYIIDHSKNGTTVDGRKLIPNNPQRIKKSSAVSCGGVPVDLKHANKIPWPSDIWKIVLASAASLLILVGIGLTIDAIVTPEPVIHTIVAVNGDTIQVNEKGDTLKIVHANFYSHKHTDSELFDKYNHAVVMLIGIYHYEVTIEGLNMDAINRYLGIPSRFLFDSRPIPVPTGISQSQLVKMIRESSSGYLSSATGFFVSKDGMIITNLHVVKPWVYDGAIENITTYVKRALAEQAMKKKNAPISSLLTAGMTEVSVKGVLDYIALVPQGETFDENNILRCRPVSAGEEKDKDVALIQTVSKRLPPDCKYVELPEALEVSEELIPQGSHIYTIGFPMGKTLQREAEEQGIQVVGQPGVITQMFEFDFGHNAASYGGASGSPIFNEYGKLIGVHHAGYSQHVTQGFNYGVKAKYVKELIENPYKK